MTGDPHTVGSSGGVPITDAIIERLADEAAAGYDLERLQRRGGRPLMGSAPADVFPVRLDPELRAALDAHARSTARTPSDIVREALRRFLDVA